MPRAAWPLLFARIACDKGPDAATPCGPDLDCAGGRICVEDRLDGECSSLVPGDVCPPGTTQRLCGGAGVDCCCAPPPPVEYRCEKPTGCDGQDPSCACLTAVCDDALECQQLFDEDEPPVAFACAPYALP